MPKIFRLMSALLPVIAFTVFIPILGQLARAAENSATIQGEIETLANEAFYIHPMELNLRPDAKAPTQVTVFNKDAHKADIHVDVFERTEGDEGSELRSATKDLVADVTDFSLEAGQTRALNLTYKGRKKLSRERAFRVVVRQTGDPGDSSLDLRFVYVASVYVTPAGAQPKLVIGNVRRTSDRAVEVSLKNDGNAHVQMNDVAAILQQKIPNGLRDYELSSESLKLWSRQNLLAGGRRKLVLQIAQNASAETSGAPADASPALSPTGALNLKVTKP
jgi:P pilus assembly chaperone PapD